jgi:PhoD-like phosphatase
VLLGDQIYADETTEHTQQRIRAKRDITVPPGPEVADFEEYTWLYQESWTDPDIRWLLSTIPSTMIFDDHDVRDDWNTSQSWREQMQKTPWWEERIVGGLSSYWVYQHIGNLSPQALADDALFAKVLASGEDCEPLLREFAAAADREADGQKGAQWSFRRDLPGVRLLVIDSRCGRVLAEGNRSMVSEAEFAWIEEHLAGDYDHLLIGTSLPWLLPRAVHDIESWNERLADGARGPVMAAVAEKFRRVADLEHWAAFRKSFDRLAELLASVGRGQRAGAGGQAPATVCVLSGDVHHAYAAVARYPDQPDQTPIRSRIYQLTCSPVHNYVPLPMKIAFRVAWSRVAERTTRVLLERVSHLPSQPLDWDRIAGPYYGNEIATLRLRGRSATLVIEKAGRDQDGNPSLTPVGELTLS